MTSESLTADMSYESNEPEYYREEYGTGPVTIELQYVVKADSEKTPSSPSASLNLMKAMN